jgi:hypothetical protein
MDHHERTLRTGVREWLAILGPLVGTLAPPMYADAHTGIGTHRTLFSPRDLAAHL